MIYQIPKSTASPAYIDIPEAHGSRIGVVAITAGSANDVMVQGRLHPSDDWVNILDAAATASGAYAVQVFPQMRYTSTNAATAVRLMT